MKEFFRSLLATIVGLIVFFFLIFFIIGGVVSSLVSKDEVVKAKPNSVLYITLNKEIQDRGTDNPFETIEFGNFQNITKLGLNDIIKNLDKAKTDDNIKGILLNLSDINAGIATINEIRDAILAFKESKKFVIAYSENYSQFSYYLATAADKVYLNPQGLVEHKGLASQLMFFKGTLEKLGIQPEIFRHGKFKSAVEPFIADKMSNENREQISTLIGTIWKHVSEGIAKQRNIPVEKLNNLADSMTINSPKAALDYHFVDGLKYYDEVIDELKDSLKVDKKKELTTITLEKYIKVPKSSKDKKGLAKDKIAVIYASGEIVSGKGGSDKIGSEKISDAIRTARLDSTIKAIVFRVNSPGGSALASEVIWREAFLAKQTKPFIVSMGDYAASGGYYISCPADTIVADPTTISGSIGVFGMFFNTKNFFNNKLGITFDKVTTNSHSDLGTMIRPTDEAEKKVIQNEIERIYDTFITHVAEGRTMDKTKVDEIGQGRVWSGTSAKEIGLVDVFGGLQTAIDIAAKKAKLENYRTVDYPKVKPPIEQVMEIFGEDAEEMVLKSKLGENYKYLETIQNVSDMQGILSRLPYYIEIH